MLSLFFSSSLAVVFNEQSDIYLEVVGNENTDSHQVFFAPHENEHVANEYLAQKISQEKGRFLVLRQAGQREISLSINNQKILVDPNRIFTLKGIHDSIKNLNPDLSVLSKDFKQAVNRSQALGQFIVTNMGGLNTQMTWLAVHNNTQGYKGDGKGGIGTVSMIRYRHKLNNGAKYLINLTQLSGDEDDLFFVTDKQDFLQMQSKGFNAVLQNPIVTSDIEEDDGSLSVYAQMNGIRYINIEAEREYQGKGENHLPMQIKMLNYTLSLH
jgi:hypothetical protein